MKKRLIIFFIILMLSLVYAFTSPYELAIKFIKWINDLGIRAVDTLNDFFFSLPPQPQSYAGITMLKNTIILMFISILLSVFIYYGLKLLNVTTISPEAIINYKINYTLTSLILILIIFSVLNLVNNTDYSLSNIGNVGNYVYLKYAIEFTRKLLGETVVYLFEVSIINYILSMISNFTLPVTLNARFVFAVQINFYQAFKPILDSSFFVSHFIDLIVIEYSSKLFLLMFIQNYLFTLLIPIGFFFRAFPSIKGFGDSLIALSLALYFVYPFLLTLEYKIYTILAGLDLSQGSGLPNAEFGLGSLTVGFGIGVLMFFFSKLNEEKSLFSKDFLTKSFKTFASVVGSFGILLFAYGGLISILNIALNLSLLVILFGFLVPALNIYVVLVIAQDIARALGTEIDFSMFTRVI